MFSCAPLILQRGQFFTPRVQSVQHVVQFSFDLRNQNLGKFAPPTRAQGVGVGVDPMCTQVTVVFNLSFVKIGACFVTVSYETEHYMFFLRDTSSPSTIISGGCFVCCY